VQIDLNDLKMVISISVTKNSPLQMPRCGRRRIANKCKKVVENDDKYFN